jgi:hypothetical protein
MWTLAFWHNENHTPTHGYAERARPQWRHSPRAGGEMEEQALSLIRKGYAMSTRRGFLGALFSALLALALLDPGAAIAQEVKQIKLTEKHIQGFMAASKDMAKLYDGADPSADRERRWRPTDRIRGFK